MNEHHSNIQKGKFNFMFSVLISLSFFRQQIFLFNNN